LCLYRYLFMRYDPSDMEMLFNLAVSKLGPDTPNERATIAFGFALAGLGHAYVLEGNQAKADETLERGLTILDTYDCPREKATALLMYARNVFPLYSDRRQVALYKSLELFRSISDLGGIAEVEQWLCVYLRIQEQYEHAVEHAQISLQ